MDKSDTIMCSTHKEKQIVKRKSIVKPPNSNNIDDQTIISNRSRILYTFFL